MKMWSENEIFLLKKLWAEMPKEDLKGIFPDRTWKSLQRKSESLNIKRDRLLYDIGGCNERNTRYTEIESWIDGEMLGDGHVDPNGRYAHTTKYSSYAEFLKNKFKSIDISARTYDNCYFDKRTNKIYTRTFLKTRSFFKDYRNRWYSENKKIIPDGLIVNDVVFLHWFLGDGTVNKYGYSLSLATMGFSIDEVYKLKSKLFDYGLNSSITKKNNLNILKTKKSVSTLSNFLHNVDYPECYSYKFDRLKLWINKFRGRQDLTG